MNALLKNSIIVSVQADEGEPLNTPEILCALAQSALLGGAHGLRLANIENIAYIRAMLTAVPIIGITKPALPPKTPVEWAYITPTYTDMVSIAEAGADIIALDATHCTRSESVASMVQRFRKSHPEHCLMADISTLEEAHEAKKLGFDYIGTTLAGYTKQTAHLKTDQPDFELLDKIVQQTQSRVICEGRIWEPAHCKQAFTLGAYAVVIGSAITRPHQITARFVRA
jgi:N-acylglucosamine-6-phosphate 2-epimerase